MLLENRGAAANSPVLSLGFSVMITPLAELGTVTARPFVTENGAGQTLEQVKPSPGGTGAPVVPGFQFVDPFTDRLA